MGLKSDDTLSFTRSKNHPEFMVISNFSYPIFVQLFYGVPGLENDIIKALKDLKRKMSTGFNCEASVIFHLGEACFKVAPDEHLVKNALRKLYYKKISEMNGEKIVKSDWVYRHTYCKYDFTISAPDEPREFRYKIFLELDDEGNTSFQHEIVEKAKQFNKDFKAGPGYFSFPDVSIARFDVFDPHKNLDLRLSIRLYESNPKSVNRIEGHLKYLEENFCSKIEMKNGSYDLEIPDLPNGYSLTYYRKSLRKVYEVKKTSLKVKISEESVLTGSSNGDTGEEFDIYIENVDMDRALKTNAWTVGEVSKNLERVFNFGKNILQTIR